MKSFDEMAKEFVATKSIGLIPHEGEFTDGEKSIIELSYLAGLGDGIQFCSEKMKAVTETGE